MLYRYKQRVVIKNGFYKGYKGYVKSVIKDKNEEYTYDVIINVDNKDLSVLIPERDLRVAWF